ncbi:MAG TPA: efflux transporter outer membrane subunit [Phycisphaerales bacterium]|nr:efflux transporter outer membrane subunit [Phycisphaerales bacterium]
MNVPPRSTSPGGATLLLLSATSICLPACTVGPNFKSPQQHTPASFNSLSSRAPAQGVASLANDNPADIAEWWNAFEDPTLTSLVQRAAADNLDLSAAEARIREARATRDAAAAGLYPQINTSATAMRSRAPGAGTGNLFRAGFDAAWEIDVFGGIRRGVEAAEANERGAIEDWRDVRTTVVAEVATTYLDLRGAQRELAIARENLASQQETLSVTKQRFDAGFVTGLDVANAEAQVATTQSRIPTLESTIQASTYALGVLLGDEPTAVLDGVQGADAAGHIPEPPAAVPVGLPSDLLRRRPDIRRAEETLHAATAQIGVATADLYPKFSLTGSLGLQSGSLSSFGSIANRYWSFGPSVNWPLLDGGRIRANIRLQEAIATEQGIAYRRTVLIALQDAETALVNFQKEQERRAALQQAAEANRRAVELARLLYNEGKTDFLNVLSAQGLLFSSEDQLVQSTRTVSQNLVALYKALGGGWDPKAPSTPAAPEKPAGQPAARP